jgi:tetratricopeptide (TPR) repeat protein
VADVDSTSYIERLRERLRQKPDSKLFLSLAEELRKKDLTAEAVDNLVDGIRKNPDFLAAQVTLGRWYIRDKRLAEAREQFSAVLKKDPDNRYALKGIAEAGPAPEPDLPEMAEADRFIALGHYTQAMELYKGMLINSPGNKRILQRKEELAALIKFLGKDKETTIKKLNRFLEAIKIQFSQKLPDTVIGALPDV